MLKPRFLDSFSKRMLIWQPLPYVGGTVAGAGEAQYYSYTESEPREFPFYVLQWTPSVLDPLGSCGSIDSRYFAFLKLPFEGDKEKPSRIISVPKMKSERIRRVAGKEIE